VDISDESTRASIHPLGSNICPKSLSGAPDDEDSRVITTARSTASHHQNFVAYDKIRYFAEIYQYNNHPLLQRILDIVSSDVIDCHTVTSCKTKASNR
jgi:hypothetical protein